MTLLLFVLGYLALPLVVGWVYWRRGRRREAVMWTLGCLVAPVAGFMLAMAAMSPSIEGEGLGHAVVAGFVGIAAWVIVCVAGLILPARTPKTASQPRS